MKHLFTLLLVLAFAGATQAQELELAYSSEKYVHYQIEGDTLEKKWEYSYIYIYDDYSVTLEVGGEKYYFQIEDVHDSGTDDRYNHFVLATDYNGKHLQELVYDNVKHELRFDNKDTEEAILFKYLEDLLE